MSIALVVTAGFGNGTFSGTIPFIVTSGYDIGEITLTADSTFAVFGAIQSRGQGLVGLISADGQGIAGQISAFASVFGRITDRGQSVSGPIDETGQGVEGDI